MLLISALDINKLRYHKAQQPVQKSSTPLLDSEGEQQQNTPKNLQISLWPYSAGYHCLCASKPSHERWEINIISIISRRIFLNLMKNFQLHAKYSLLKKSQGKNMWDLFGFYKIIRLAKSWTKHLIPAFYALVTPIHQQKFRCKQKNLIKNKWISAKRKQSH